MGFPLRRGLRSPENLKGEQMSVESDVFIGTSFIAGGGEAEFTFFKAVDDAFWSISIVPQGTNNEVEITRLRTDSDAGGTRRIHYTVRNNTGNPTNFTRGAVRTPNS
jgi:hypothetical protein